MPKPIHPMNPFQTTGHFKSDMASELNNAMLYCCETFGEVETVNRQKVLEITPCVITLTNPYNRIAFSNDFGISIGQMCAKLLWTVMGRSDKEFLRLFSHPYIHQANTDTFAAPLGERLYMYGRNDSRDMTYNPLNQFIGAMQVLCKNPQSGMAVCNVWNPHYETPVYVSSHHEVPSILSMMFKIHRGELNATVFCRKMNIPAELFRDVLFECASLHELMYTLLKNDKNFGLKTLQIGSLTFMTESAYTFEGETRRDYSIAPFTFETESEPRMNIALSDLEQFNEFLYMRVFPFLMDDTCVYCDDAREELFKNMSDEYANGILDEFWMTVIKLTLAERLMRAQEFEAALHCVRFTDVSSYTAQFLHTFSHEILVTRNVLTGHRKEFDSEIGAGAYARIKNEYAELASRQTMFSKHNENHTEAFTHYFQWEVE